ncbi:flagellar basal body L-ring protein FlgH [Bacteriovorax sp. Seq25_V]|uniref:flagellar basal body L-ring protein FlgH n=1 Tax=Bacteriovorax sp. Seq25_V TaxID=1201288 RepID=UPI00038A1D5E|nr:flagellar basal body L-ring protein FlgH [Bacteriovorax sp. Seq25_V]EQC43535.1 flagellar L-ring protein FlgH [Bacteriovorax sp. Seq25_V]
MKNISLILTFFLLSSCANYINKIHNDLDRAQGREQVARKKHDSTFNQFRKSSHPSITTSNSPNMIPSVKRNYVPQNQVQRRYTANDLTDNSSDGSLWAGSGNENYLFTKNKWKRNGDIILINVQSRLKNMITMELKRAFPSMPRKPKKADSAAGAGGATSVVASPESDPVEESDVPDDDKVHDKISSVVIEEISKDHLLVRGQKYLLFRNQKHLIEVQALIGRKDIMDDDSVDSKNFLESSIVVLR